MSDLIDRRAAIDAIADDRDMYAQDRLKAVEILDRLPPAQPVHNTGKWVRGTSHGLGVYNWTCKCGHVIVAKVPDRFCGACGCDNEETDD